MLEECILSFKNRSEVLELPYPLQSFELGNPHNNYTFSTINIGDVLAIGKSKLKTLSIDSFFPKNDAPYLINHNFKDPMACVATIEKWRISGHPIRVTIVGAGINLAMAIDGFTRGRDEGDGSGDIAFTLDLSEYSYLNVGQSKSIGQINKDRKKKELNERPKEKEDNPTKHKVRKGDTMWDMAEKYYHDGNKWPAIAKANGMKDGRDLKVGQEIKIPKLEGK